MTLSSRARLRATRSTSIALVALAASAFGVSAARADGPGSGTPTVVSLGDSYISGEAGRWAGNTNQSSSKTDALGATAAQRGAVAQRIASIPLKSGHQRGCSTE